MTYWGTNTYLIDAPGGVLVLDPGPDDQTHVDAVLAAAGAPITGILLSHTHHDHLGAVASMRQATGAPVSAWHDPATPAFVPEKPLRDGDTVGEWQAFHTPGHASDHVVFVRADGTVFSADHVMGWSTSVVAPPGGNMADYVRSLARMAVRDDRILLPGHGPAIPNPPVFVREMMAHREKRERLILDALDIAAQTSAALVRRIYIGLDPSLHRAAERNVVAHLHKLAGEGRAMESAGGWVRG